MSDLVFRPVRHTRGAMITPARRPTLSRQEFEKRLRAAAKVEPLHRRIRGARRSASR